MLIGGMWHILRNLLAEWFYMKRSLRVQELAQRIIAERFHAFLEEKELPDHTAINKAFAIAFDRWQMLGQSKTISSNRGAVDDATAAPSLQRSKSATTQFDAFFAYMSFCSGRISAQRVLDEEEAELRSVLGLSDGSQNQNQSSHGIALAKSLWGSEKTSVEDSYKEINDVLPPKVEFTLFHIFSDIFSSTFR